MIDLFNKVSHILMASEVNGDMIWESSLGNIQNWVDGSIWRTVINDSVLK